MREAGRSGLRVGSIAAVTGRRARPRAAAVLRQLPSRLGPPVVGWVGRAQLRNRLLGVFISQLTRPLTKAEIRIPFGPAAGMRMRAGRSNPGYALGTTEPALQRLLFQELRAGGVFFDIGANVGFFTLIGARCLSPSGMVYAFEPLPDNVSALRHNLDINRLSHVAVMPEAVADQCGSADLVDRELDP